MIIASSAFRHATRFYPEAERGRFSIPIEITIRLIIGLIVLSADLSSVLPLSLSLSPRFNGQRCNADACTRSACAVSCVNALRRARRDLWDHGPANRRSIFQESRDGRVVVPWETFSNRGGGGGGGESEKRGWNASQSNRRARTGRLLENRSKVDRFPPMLIRRMYIGG